MVKHNGVIRERNFFIRFFSIYLAIILLPIIVTWLLWTWHTTAKTQQALEDAAYSMLASIQLNVDNEFRELRETAVNIYYDSVLQSIQKVHDPYSRMETVNALKRIVRYNRDLEQIILLHPDGEYMLSSSGTVTPRVLDYFIWGKALANEEIINTILARSTPMTLVSSDRHFVFYVEPLNFLSETKWKTAIFCLKDNYVKTLIDTHPVAGASAVFITTEDGQTLYSSGDKELYEAILNMEKKGTPRFRHGKNGYVSVSLATQNGWHLRVVLPAPLYLWEMLSLNSLITILMIMLVIVCAMIAYRIAQKQSKPLDQLAKNYNTKGTDSPRITTLDSLVNYVLDTNNAQSNALSQQNNMLQDQMLYCLFDQNNSPSFDDLQDLVHQQGLPVEGSYQAAYIHKPHTNDIIPDLSKVISGLSLEPVHAVITPMRPMNGYGLLLYSPLQNEDPESFSSTIETIADTLREEITPALAIGVGSICHHLLKISHSFEQARLASEYQLIFSSSNIIAYENVKEAHSGFNLLKLGDLVRFSESLRARRCSAAQDMIISMIEELRNSQNSPILIKCMCSEIISQFLRTVYDMHIDCQDYLRLFSYDSLNELEQNLIRATESVCAIPDEGQTSFDQALYQRIQQYITTHLSSYDLSLSTLSEAIGYSAPYTGRIVKTYTGKTFTEYVTDLRIETVCKLLVSSELPIREIITMVGYSDASSFNRKFKSIVGITPTEYRRRIAKEGEPT